MREGCDTENVNDLSRDSVYLREVSFSGKNISNDPQCDSAVLEFQLSDWIRQRSEITRGSEHNKSKHCCFFGPAWQTLAQHSNSRLTLKALNSLCKIHGDQSFFFVLKAL